MSGVEGVAEDRTASAGTRHRPAPKPRHRERTWGKPAQNHRLRQGARGGAQAGAVGGGRRGFGSGFEVDGQGTTWRHSVTPALARRRHRRRGRAGRRSGGAGGRRSAVPHKRRGAGRRRRRRRGGWGGGTLDCATGGRIDPNDAEERLAPADMDEPASETEDKQQSFEDGFNVKDVRQARMRMEEGRSPARSSHPCWPTSARPRRSRQQAVMEQLDTDGGDEVSFGEFADFWKKMTGKPQDGQESERTMRCSRTRSAPQGGRERRRWRR